MHGSIHLTSKGWVFRYQEVYRGDNRAEFIDFEVPVLVNSNSLPSLIYSNRDSVQDGQEVDCDLIRDTEGYTYALICQEKQPDWNTIINLYHHRSQRDFNLTFHAYLAKYYDAPNRTLALKQPPNS